MIIAACVTLLLLTALMGGAWALQRATANAGWVDVVWTFGTGVAAVVLALLPSGPAPAPRRLMLAGLVGVWSGRLGVYVARRVAGLGREDVRYAAFRRDWGAAFQRRMFRFVIVQGPIAAVLAIAVMLAAHVRAPFPTIGDVAGAIVCAAGLATEMIADRQMRRFRAGPDGGAGVCDRGLWGHTRHPNYLGEFVFWCGVPVVALGAGTIGAGVAALAAPAMMYWLLVHVSGIPPLERAMLASRGEAYRAFQARVPAFFPRLRRAGR